MDVVDCIYRAMFIKCLLLLLRRLMILSATRIVIDGYIYYNNFGRQSQSSDELSKLTNHHHYHQTYIHTYIHSYIRNEINNIVPFQNLPLIYFRTYLFLTIIIQSMFPILFVFSTIYYE